MRGPSPRWPGSVQGGVHSQYLGKCTPGQPLPGLPAVWGCIWASHPEASSPPRVRPRADRDRPRCGFCSQAPPQHGSASGKTWEGQEAVGTWPEGGVCGVEPWLPQASRSGRRCPLHSQRGRGCKQWGGPLTPEAASAPPPKDSDPVCVQAGCPVPSPHVSRVPRPWL